MKHRNPCASSGPHRPPGPGGSGPTRSESDEVLHEALEVRDSPIHGKGLFASRPIARDTLLGVYEGEPAHENSTYVLWVEYDDGEVVGIEGKNDLRFANHSRTPNAEFWGDRLYALSDITKDAEITFDYGEDWEHVE
jgi:SET domain-containing protein